MIGHKLFSLSLIGIVALGLVACSSNRGGEVEECEGSACVVPTPTPTTDVYYIPYSTPAPTESCLNASAVLARSANTTGTVRVGDTVIFQLTVSGCSQYRVERFDNGPSGTFSQPTIAFTKQYTAASPSIQEGVRVIALDSAGGEARVITAFAPAFAVEENIASINFSCDATANAAVIDIPVNPTTGQALVVPPMVQFNVASNRNMRIASASAAIGAIVPLSTLPSAAAAMTQNYTASVTRLYQNQISFQIRDEQYPTLVRTCSAQVYLRPVVVAQAPTCELTASHSWVTPGTQVTFSLTGHGTIQTATIDGVQVDPFAGRITTPIYSSRTILAQVSGPAGTSSCQVTVNANPIQVGINYEDWRDNDYNDAVVCMNGLFEINGDQILSRAEQVVTASTYWNSGCNARVNVRVYSAAGVLTWENTYWASHRPTLQIPFSAGSRLETTFTSSGCTSGSFGLGSSRVHHGNACNSYRD